MTLSLAAQEKKPLPMPWSRIQRVLDAMEARFVRGALRLQEARVQALRPLVERVLETGLVPADIPLEGSFPALVADFAAEVLVEGLVHASADVLASERRARAAGVELKVDGGPVVPKEALAFLESRRDLARFFDPDQVDKVRTILGNSLREGATVKQTMDALQTALPAASRARLENIARTEATAAYNQGRLYRFLQSKGFIVAVQFMATLDSRVTDICEHRDGLVFSLKDPRIRENTPPLHFQCRSILSPVSGYELEELGGQERLDKDARTMDDAPGVQVTKKGRFGSEPWPDVQKEGREEFKARAEEKIRAAAPNGTFDKLVPESVKRQGDEFLKNSDSTAYNVALSDDYVRVHTGNRPVFVYHQYPGMEEHGAELAAVFRDLGLPHEFEVMSRASTVKWKPGWYEPPGYVSETVDGVLMGRTVEYAMVFEVQDIDQVHRMLAVIRNQFTEYPDGPKGYPGSWDVPDARIVGVPPATGSKSSQVLWISEAERLFTLTKEMVRMAPEVQINSELWEFVS